MKTNTTIVWFRKDLRIHDHPALLEASQQGTVLPVFIWSPDEEVDSLLAEASQWWLHHSLQDLEKQLQQLGLPLILRQGASLPILQEIIQESNATALYFTERYEPSIRHRDDQIKQVLRAEKINVKSFHAQLLFEPLSITNQQNKAYKVFTPFWKQCLKKTVPLPLPSPSACNAPTSEVQTGTVDDLALLSSFPWYNKFASYWTPGEQGANKQWTIFLQEKINGYKKSRDIPTLHHSSHLSPHLAWGEISPKLMWITLIDRQDIQLDSDIETFLKQLVWREFSYHQLVHIPSSIKAPIRQAFTAFPWADDEPLLTCWKKGLTGYPIIDAGMRELWETGQMHNRVRMVTASFLVKHLLIHWKKGADWFTETLVDFDVANNTMGWQWVAGSGVDASPYFRIFNPVLQGKKFDSDGEYVRKWLPELTNLPTAYIHQPWKAPQTVLQKSEVVLGTTYPLPIVDHASARDRALRAYHSIKT